MEEKGRIMSGDHPSSSRRGRSSAIAVWGGRQKKVATPLEVGAPCRTKREREREGHGMEEGSGGRQVRLVATREEISVLHSLYIRRTPAMVADGSGEGEQRLVVAGCGQREKGKQELAAVLRRREGSHQPHSLMQLRAQQCQTRVCWGNEQLAGSYHCYETSPPLPERFGLELVLHSQRESSWPGQSLLKAMR